MKPVVVVTGASKGIGLAITRILLKKFGANVVAISRSRTAELVELSSSSLMVIQCDVSDEKALSDAINEGASHYQRIDGLVLNAGTLDPCGRVGDNTPLEAWKNHFDVNFFSLVAACKAALPSLRNSALGGKIIFVSSGAAVKGLAGWGPYNARLSPKRSRMSLLWPSVQEWSTQTCKTRSVLLGQPTCSKKTTIYSFRAIQMGNLLTQRIVDMLSLPFLCKHLRVLVGNSSTGIPKNVMHIEKTLYKIKGTLLYSFKIYLYALIAARIVSRTTPSGINTCVPSPVARVEGMMANSLMSRTLLNPKVRRIDIHHHFFTADLNKERVNSKLGWKTPEGSLPWSAKVSLSAMDAMNIDVAILSFPPISSGSIGEDNRALARRRNEYVAKVCTDYPDRFGFFATLPFLDDTDGCLQEIQYAMDELHAYGVSLASCYGDGAAAKYVGHGSFHTIWAELNRRKVVVFLHGSQIPSSTPYPHEFLGVPITEAPNETFKAAAHLVVTGHRRMFPDVKIILAHLGGTTPFLASRVAVLSYHMGCPLSPEEILDDFRSFYYETALSSYEPNLLAIEKFVQHDHILFGSDFPAVSKDMAEWFTAHLQTFYADKLEKLNEILCSNALKLFLGPT